MVPSREGSRGTVCVRVTTLLSPVFTPLRSLIRERIVLVKGELPPVPLEPSGEGTMLSSLFFTELIECEEGVIEVAGSLELL